MENRLPLLGLLSLAGLALSAEAATIELTVRDSRTGAPLDAQVAVRTDGGGMTELAVKAGQRTAVALPVSGGVVEVRARGYRPLAHRFQPDRDGFPVTYWLDDRVLSSARPDIGQDLVVRGHVYDEGTLTPIEGARVLLDAGAEGLVAEVTDARGEFELRLESATAEQSQPRTWQERLAELFEPRVPVDHPRVGRILIDAPGHATRILEGVVLEGGYVTLIEDLPRGTGESREDLTPMALRPASEHALHQTAPAAGDAAPLLFAAPIAGQDLVGMTPPASIAVGTGCSCTSCSGATVLSLETYVGSGLDNEWISSWSAHSLRAGAIPYRSYGAWYVANPISPSYDICSTTCCQVWGSTAYSSTQSAGALTAGFMLERGGNLLRSEYSAENNSLLGTMSCVNGDLSCGDGFAGSPATGWSCLSDAPCSGQDCFGHGRGECQWGTQRWASGQGELWNWITHHYYNGNGTGSGSRTAYPTSPITMPAFSPSPSTVGPGDTFTIDVTADNAAGLDHAEIMIGASLYSAATGYVDDPANDTKVYLSVGSNNVSRPFTVPLSTPGGTYDLLVALYYDVNGDNVISGADQSLLLQTLTGGVTVVTCGTITLSPGSLPNGIVGVSYSQQLSASGGSAPYGFAVTSGSLPAGLTLSSAGLVSGTPSATGTSTFTVTATDSGGCTGSQGYSITVTAFPSGNVVTGMGLGPANRNRVRVFRGDGTATAVDFDAYAAGAWGVNVAAADVSGLFTEQILTGPGPGDQFGPQVRAFQRDGTPIAKVSFFAYGTLKYGVNVAGGSLDADGYAEMQTGPGPGAVFGPHVRGFDYDGAALAAMPKVSFFAYGTLKYGVNVAAGSLDADGYAEIEAGPGPGAIFGPQVRGFDYDATTIAPLPGLNFFAFSAPQYGVNVAAGDTGGDASAELAAAPGPGAGASFRAHFKGFDWDGSAVDALPGFDVTVGTTSYGGRVGLGDVTASTAEELLAGLGRDPAAPATVAPYRYSGGLIALTPWNAYTGSTYGVNAAGGFLGY